jgi:hypothetical protein
MSRGKKILIGVIVLLVLFCGAFMLFVNWANSDSGQQTFKEVETRQAIESATAAVQSTQDAVAAANAAGTTTAVMAAIDNRLQNAQLVYEEGLDEGSPLIAENIKDFDLSFEDGVATIWLPWDGSSVWEIGKELTDFAAEMDCIGYGSGVYCGFAYGIHHNNDKTNFYASVISGSASCGFFDFTTNFTRSNYDYCNYPHSSESFLQHLRLEKFGSNIRFYVNGKLMDESILEKADFLSGGFALFFGRAGGESSEINQVHLDNLKVWELP